MSKSLSNIYFNILERLELREMEVVLFLPFLPLIALLDLYKIIYIPFAAVLIMRIIQYVKKQILLTDALLGLCIYSIILPDNYTIFVFVFALFLVFLKGYINKKDYGSLKMWIKKHNKLLILLGIFLLINIIFNRVPPQNIIFEILYFSVFIFMLIIYKNGDFNYTKEINRSINAVIFIEFIYLLIFVPIRVNMIKTQLIGDWSVGTLGTSQGTILFMLYIFTFIKFLHQYFESKDLYFAVFALICFFGAISTVTISLTVFFIFSICAYAIFFLKGLKPKIILLASTILMVTIFWNISHPWIKNGIIKTFTDSEYRKERIKKLKTYEDTFIRIPMSDKKFLLIGNGMGNYSSRAALTVSGYYVNWFKDNKFVGESNYTNVYINPEIYTNFGVSETDTPSSQYISLMGEFGIIGFLLFFYYIFVLLYKERGFNRLIIIFLLGAFTMDNYLEYYKIALIILSSYYYIKYSMTPSGE